MTCQRRFDDRDEALMQGKAGDDDFGRIVERGVEQAADGLSQAGESASVALPISSASGMIDSAEAAKTRIGLKPNQSSPSATGMTRAASSSSRRLLRDQPQSVDAESKEFTSRAAWRRPAAGRLAPSIKPRTAALSLGMPRATSATGRTTP